MPCDHQLETARLILRPWREGDASALFRSAHDPELGESCGWLPHPTVEHSQRILSEVLCKPECYAIVVKRHRSLDCPVGSIALLLDGASTLGVGTREAEIGYWLARPFWGNGYMPEAVDALMRHAFADLGLNAVWSGWYEGNERSRRVQEKLGLVPCRVMPDRPRPELGDRRTLYLTRLTREEWKLAQRRDPTGAEYVAAQQRETADILAHIPLVSAIRSGGQTGADRAGLDAARELGIPTCGWCPKDGLAEDMAEPPGVLTTYPELRETPSSGYVQRTAWNVRDAHATLIVAPGGLEPRSGTEATEKLARAYGRPCLVVQGLDDIPAAQRWLAEAGRGLVLNVAGPRASKVPAVYAMTHDIVLALLAEEAPGGEPSASPSR